MVVNCPTDWCDANKAAQVAANDTADMWAPCFPVKGCRRFVCLAAG